MLKRIEDYNKRIKSIAKSLKKRGYVGRKPNFTADAKGNVVKNFKKGDKVAALVNGGGYAEFCSSDKETTFLIPKNISLKEAFKLHSTIRFQKPGCKLDCRSSRICLSLICKPSRLNSLMT